MLPRSIVPRAGSIVPASSTHEDQIIQNAIALLEQRLFHAGPVLPNLSAVQDYLRLQLAAEPNEVFAVLFLNNRSRLLAYEPLFQGTVNGVNIYPRLVIQRTLAHNAASVILAHQHPSGSIEPSLADRAMTRRLQTALDAIDVRVLDHLIVGKGEPYSFSAAGLLNPV